MEKLHQDMIKALATHESQLRTTDSSVGNLKRKNLVVAKTLAELKASGKDSVWEAVGRTFVEIPIAQYEGKLKNEITVNLETINSLNKKKHYLETSIDTTKESLSKLKLMG